MTDHIDKPKANTDILRAQHVSANKLKLGKP